jgi:DNA-directed RNA polymerase subunit M/transcription elongation factor TFIIS
VTEQQCPRCGGLLYKDTDDNDRSWRCVICGRSTYTAPVERETENVTRRRRGPSNKGMRL